jgi:chorismate-pyruvate lyase
MAAVLPWPDTPVARIEAQALVETLNADLLSHDSATLTLDRWCADHRLAEPATVTAERVRGVDKPASAEIRAALRVDAATPVAYRSVRLRCGAHVLSEADNWYVPGRLTPAMNQALDTSDIAFGRAVQALRFSRHTLSAELLWSPLPQGWEMQGLPAAGSGALAIPHHVLEHRAVLSTPDGTPFSLVVEDYTEAVLAFPPPNGK